MYKKMNLLVFLLCFGTSLFAQYPSPYTWSKPKTGGNNWFGSARGKSRDVIAFGAGSMVEYVNRAQSTYYQPNYFQGHTEKSQFASPYQYYLWTNYDYSASTLYANIPSSGTDEIMTLNAPVSSFSFFQNHAVLVGDQKIHVFDMDLGETTTILGPDPTDPDQLFTTTFNDIITRRNGGCILAGSNSCMFTTNDLSHYDQAHLNFGFDINIMEISDPRELSFDVPKGKITQSDTFFAVGNQFASTTVGVVIKSTDDGATWDSVYAVPNVTLRAVSAGSNTNVIIAGNTYSGSVLYYTKDGGDTWAEGEGSPNYIYSITHVSADSAYAVGAKGSMLLTTDGGEHWTQLSDDNPGFSGIYFSSPSVGYAMSLTEMNILSIHKTTDAGESWNISYIDSSFAPSTAFLNSIFFIDDMTGFIAGSKFIKTTDGGSTWNEMQPGVTSDAIFQDVYFVNNSLGFVVYRDPFNGDGAIKTTDGGTTWNPVNINNDKYDKGFIYFADENLGFISGYSTLYRSTDGGDNWDTLAVGTNSQDLNSKVTFINSTTGFFGKKGQVLNTTDRGETWTDAPIDNHSIPREIQFVSDSVGYLVCTSDTFGIPVHILFKTTDGGHSWSDLTDKLPGTTGFQHVFFTDQITGYLAGSAGIVKTTTGGDVPTAIEPLANASLPSGFTLDQNYPNPFNPVTTIQYVLSRNIDVRLVVYDITGRQVRTLINQKQAAGRYSIEWDGTNNNGEIVSSGVYFYRIVAGSKILSNKMVYLK